MKPPPTPEHVAPPAFTPDELLRPAEVARRTGYAEATLATLRVRGSGPPFRKRVGGRAVFYVWSDVLAWLGQPSESTTPRSGSDHTAAASREHGEREVPA